MALDYDDKAWLDKFPLDAHVEIGGKSVCLKRGVGGAELEVILFSNYTQDELQRALNQGFPSAMLFDAGLGQTDDGQDLVLSQWVPGVRMWSDAGQVLEKLLNQLDGWLEILNPATTARELRPIRKEDRHAQRLRSLISDGK